MDALDLLSGSENSDADAADQIEILSAGPPGKRQKTSAISTHISDVCAEDVLKSYAPTELLQTASYLRDAELQSARRPVSQLAPVAPEPEMPAEDSIQDEVQCAIEMGPSPPPPKPPTVVVRQRKDSPHEVPGPWHSFLRASNSTALGLPAILCDALSSAGFFTPTAIQSYAMPIVGAGRDFIGVAETGSGKTLAYLLPCFSLLLRPKIGPVRPDSDGFPAALMLGPTRELVCQIEKEANRFGKATEIRIEVLYGGAPKLAQLAGLRARPQVVIATPGRLADFLKTEPGSCTLKHVRYLVLDEADRMFDDGFEREIRSLVDQCVAPRRQTLLFSATWPACVENLAMEILNDPVEVRTGDRGQLRANPSIVQDVLIVKEEFEKPRALVGLLNRRSHPRIIVFVGTKRSCRFLETKISDRVAGGVASIHGDKSQRDREAALEAFRGGQVRTLLATDVAGRGLDVRDVTLVVNFDPPRSAEDYVHRIGRTGRAGQGGMAISIFVSKEKGSMQDVASIMRATGLELPPALARCLHEKPNEKEVMDPRAHWREKFHGLDSNLYSKEDLKAGVRQLWQA